MLKIRLQRVGRVHDPKFRLVVTESTNSSKSGRFLEVLGAYDPRTDECTVNGERAKHWLSRGAKATPTIHNLLITTKVITGKKINVLPKKSAPAKEPEAAVEAPATAAPAAQAPAAEAPLTEIESIADTESSTEATSATEEPSSVRV